MFENKKYPFGPRDRPRQDRLLPVMVIGTTLNTNYHRRQAAVCYTIELKGTEINQSDISKLIVGFSSKKNSLSELITEPCCSTGRLSPSENFHLVPITELNEITNVTLHEDFKMVTGVPTELSSVPNKDHPASRLQIKFTTTTYCSQSNSKCNSTSLMKKSNPSTTFTTFYGVMRCQLSERRQKDRRHDHSFLAHIRQAQIHSSRPMYVGNY